MKKLKFRYISAKNFMCFGPEGIEIFFDDLGNVTLVKGLNLDTGTEVNPASNGAGKSSIQDIISYGLYGKTVKKPKKLDQDTVINAIHKKKLEVVVEFDDLRVLRGQEPQKLKIWRSKDHIWTKDTDITPGGRGEPQKLIDKSVGLSHTAFCNVVVFDDSNSYAFLELDTPGKRGVVENLLGLDRYKDHHETAKELLKNMKKKLDQLVKDYSHAQNDIDAQTKRVEKIEQQQTAWRATKQMEANEIIAKIKTKQKELELCDVAAATKAYDDAQLKIEQCNTSLADLENKRARAVAALKEAKDKRNEVTADKETLAAKVQEHTINVRRYLNDITKSKELVKSLEGLEEGAKCPVCHGGVSRQNYASVLTHEQNTVAGLTDRMNKENRALQDVGERLEKRKLFIQKIDQHIEQAENVLVQCDKKAAAERAEIARLLKIQRPEAGVREKVLETEIVELKRQLKAKQDEASGDSPYKEILESAVQEKEQKTKDCAVKTQELRVVEKEIPYYEFWVEAFGDKGIRKYVIDGIIPALNAKIAYWMQYLIDAKIELTFDSELEPTIKVCGMETEYHAMSNGEKRRINLAVSQAFAYVMMLNSGSCPSIVFLDEITGGGIDRAGVTGIYNMIFELAKERQVFVTTHNDTLLNMLQGCGSITLVKKDGITKFAA